MFFVWRQKTTTHNKCTEVPTGTTRTEVMFRIVADKYWFLHLHQTYLNIGGGGGGGGGSFFVSSVANNLSKLWLSLFMKLLCQVIKFVCAEILLQCQVIVLRKSHAIRILIENSCISVDRAEFKFMYKSELIELLLIHWVDVCVCVYKCVREFYHTLYDIHISV